MWSVGHVKCKVGSVECKVRSGDCRDCRDPGNCGDIGVQSVECRGVLKCKFSKAWKAIKCGMGSVECGVLSVVWRVGIAACKV